MKRKLMMVERIMYVDKNTPLNSVFAAKISGSISLQNLNLALFKIQQKHVLLRAKIEENEENIFFVSNENTKPIAVRIVNRENNNCWLAESEKEWYRLFEEENQALMQVVWIKSENVSELLLVLPHCICDGGTCVALMSELLSLLDNPTKELIPYIPFKSVQELLPADFDLIKKTRKAKFISLLAKLYFALKCTKSKTKLGKSYVLHWKLDEIVSSQVTKFCKTEGITVHTALCAAFIIGFEKVLGTKAKGKVISPVDIRRFIPKIEADHMFAFAPIVELGAKQKKEYIFSELANQIKTELNKKIQKINAYEMLWMGEFMHSSVKKMISVLKTTKGNHDITLSNMGKLPMEDNYTHFKLETLYSPTLAFPWRNPNTLVVSTFNQQMDFAFMSNDNFLAESEALAIKKIAMATLSIGLPKLSYA